MKTTFNPSLYLVTDSRMLAGRDMVDVVLQAVEGGCTMVQLREKEASTRQFLNLAIRLKAALRNTHVPLIINDRIDIALAADADGVHIGQSDMPYDIARRLLGENKLIGLSVETDEELMQANNLDVDYVALSPVFATPTKTDTATPWGIEGIHRAKHITRHPLIGIGGMNTDIVSDVITAGLDGVAVVSAIMAASNPKAAAEKLKITFCKYVK